jgi:hypothetical protein
MHQDFDIWTFLTVEGAGKVTGKEGNYYNELFSLFISLADRES